MDLIPAIDVLDGRVVRLLRGDYDEVTEYSDDPVAIGLRWMGDGARIVHVVDLDAARGGDRDTAVLERLSAAGVRFQVGGGIRSAAEAAGAVDSGAERVVVGSAFTGNGPSAMGIVEAVGAQRVVAAVDVRRGRAVGSGWLDTGSPLARTLARIGDVGVTRAIVTGIDRDGTLQGPDITLLEDVRRRAPEISLIASGGVGSVADLVALSGSALGIEAAIVGRALYENRFSLPEAIAAMEGR
jgi:phosphoribosylformimino-5-aminoimidazole carboxamide ribotide isomerase